MTAPGENGFRNWTWELRIASRIVNGNDIGVIETGNRPSLLDVAVCAVRICQKPSIRNFNGDPSLEQIIVGQKDQAKTAFAHKLFNPVAID